jgi:hypothetical protein
VEHLLYSQQYDFYPGTIVCLKGRSNLRGDLDNGSDFAVEAETFSVLQKIDRACDLASVHWFTVPIVRMLVYGGYMAELI